MIEKFISVNPYIVNQLQNSESPSILFRLSMVGCTTQSVCDLVVDSCLKTSPDDQLNKHPWG